MNRAAPNTIPTAAKAGGNYLSSLLVGGEARRHGYDEGIALSVDGYLSEGAGENLFVVRDGILSTPPATSAILPGITRDSIMTLAKDMGYEIREENIAREALYLADEVFMTAQRLKSFQYALLTRLPLVKVNVVLSQKRSKPLTLVCSMEQPKINGVG